MQSKTKRYFRNNDGVLNSTQKIPPSKPRKIAKALRSRSFNEDDRKTLNEILETVESFKNEIEELRNKSKTS